MLPKAWTRARSNISTGKARTSAGEGDMTAWTKYNWCPYMLAYPKKHPRWELRYQLNCSAFNGEQQGKNTKVEQGIKIWIGKAWHSEAFSPDLKQSALDNLETVSGSQSRETNREVHMVHRQQESCPLELGTGSCRWSFRKNDFLQKCNTTTWFIWCIYYNRRKFK